LAMAVISLTAFTTILVLGGVRHALGPELGVVLWIALSAMLLKSSFAIFSLRRHAMPISSSLERGDLEGARKGAALIVSRDVGVLDEAHVSSAAVESVSENAVDSIFSPLLYNGIGGPPLAMAFRSVNIMDAMIGYLKPSHVHVGRFAAKLDDAANFVAARISLPFIALAAVILGEDAKAALSMARRDHAATPSPNSGWSMAAVAGALGVKMEKIGCYVIGDGELPVREDIAPSLALVEASSALFAILASLPLYIFIGIHVQLYLEDLLISLLGV
jgi:adenosylcobinamide-phosphate synthase